VVKEQKTQKSDFWFCKSAFYHYKLKVDFCQDNFLKVYRKIFLSDFQFFLDKFSPAYYSIAAFKVRISGISRNTKKGIAE
jgi:hypothetical protein